MIAAIYARKSMEQNNPVLDSWRAPWANRGQSCWTSVAGGAAMTRRAAGRASPAGTSTPRSAANLRRSRAMRHPPYRTSRRSRSSRVVDTQMNYFDQHQLSPCHGTTGKMAAQL
jgi:hypothetical protein